MFAIFDCVVGVPFNRLCRAGGVDLDKPVYVNEFSVI